MTEASKEDQILTILRDLIDPIAHRLQVLEAAVAQLSPPVFIGGEAQTAPAMEPGLPMPIQTPVQPSGEEVILVRGGKSLSDGLGRLVSFRVILPDGGTMVVVYEDGAPAKVTYINTFGNQAVFKRVGDQ